MSTNKSISYLLCNKDIIVNLYKFHFLSSHFSFQPNKRVFHPPNFPSFQPNTHEEKLNIFHPSTIFHHSTFPLLQPNGPLVERHISYQKTWVSLQILKLLIYLLFNFSTVTLVITTLTRFSSTPLRPLVILEPMVGSKF